MPKPGFTTLTVGDVIYDTWHDFYKAREKKFKLKGINSLSALITTILDAVMRLDGQRLTELIQTEADPSV